MLQYTLGDYAFGDADLDTVLFNRDMAGFEDLCETGTLWLGEPFDQAKCVEDCDDLGGTPAKRRLVNKCRAACLAVPEWEG